MFTLISHLNLSVASFMVIALISVLWTYFLHKNDHRNSWISNLSQDDYFGPNEIHADDETIYQFKVNIDDERIDDFKQRMKSGVKKLMNKKVGKLKELRENLQFLKEISDALDQYNWKQHQYFINTFQHYQTEIEGLRIHFIRTVHRDSYKITHPIILLHSWTSSFWEFYKIIPILSNPHRFGFYFGKIAFDVIVPSLPGHIFSDPSSRTGFGLLEVSRILVKLSDRLLLNRYLVYGYGEMGCQIVDMMALLRPDKIAGLFLLNPSPPVNFHSASILKHLQCGFGIIATFGCGSVIDYEDSEKIMKLFGKELNFHGPLFLESPLAAAGLILQHWASRTDPQHRIHGFSNLSNYFTVDDLLTNIILYWSTDSFISAFHFLKKSEKAEQFQRYTLAAMEDILFYFAQLQSIGFLIDVGN